MPFFVIKKGLVLLEWKYFPTPKILDPKKMAKRPFFSLKQTSNCTILININIQCRWMFW